MIELSSYRNDLTRSAKETVV